LDAANEKAYSSLKSLLHNIDIELKNENIDENNVNNSKDLDFSL
jgi:hypothetical protein